jgi:hypothetical protein
MARRIRIKAIALDFSGQRFEEGEIVLVDGETPLDLAACLQARLDAETAEVVSEEIAPPAEVETAIAAFTALAQAQSEQLEKLIDLGLVNGPAAAAAILAAFGELQLQSLRLGPAIVELQALAELYVPALPKDTQQDEPDADAEQAGATGSGSAQADSEASAGGGPTDAEVLVPAGTATDTEAPPPAPAGGEGNDLVQDAQVTATGGTGENPPVNDPPAVKPAATTPRRSSGSKAKAK